MLLFELFTDPAPIKPINDNQYQFIVNGVDYRIVFNRTILPMDFIDEQSERNPPAVDVVFYSKTKDGHEQTTITGNRNQFTVLSTVIASISRWLKQNNAEYVTFTADKSEQSRVKVYQRILDKIDAHYKTVELHDGQIMFIVPVDQFK